MKNSQTLRIFLVDDSPYIRETIKALLSENGDYIVSGEAGGVKESLELIPKSQSDLILLDFQLKDGNALQVLKALRDSAIMTPVYIFTNYADDRYRNACIELGARGFFDKNKDLFLLWDEIERYRNIHISGHRI